MKKLCVMLTAVGLLTATSVQSQTTQISTKKASERVTVGFQVGLNFPNLVVSAGNRSVSMGHRTAFNVGMTVDLPILECLYVRSGLLFTQKGFDFDYKGAITGVLPDGTVVDLINIRMTANPSYLELPILASLRMDVGRNVRVLLNAGPYIAYGIGGKAEWKRGQISTTGYSSYTDAYGDDDDRFFGKDGASRFDCGLHTGLTVQVYKHFEVGVAYEWGVTNIGPDDSYKMRNRNGMLTVGYRL